MKRDRLVVLLSGGMDSTLAFLIAKARGENVLGLFVDLGQPYVNKERKAIESLKKSYADCIETISVPIVSHRLGNVPTVSDQVILGRNLTLASIGANYGDRLWLCALDGEMHDLMPDKNKAFFEITTKALSQAYGRPITLETPFEHYTKAKLVAHALDLGITPQQITSTSTCYHPTIQKCGRCSACVKRWIALSLNNVKERYQEPPEKSEYAMAYLASLRHAWEYQDFSHYNEQRIMEGFSAFNQDCTPPLFPRDKE